MRYFAVQHCRSIYGLLALIFAAPAVAESPPVAWEHAFEHPVQFHSVISEELVLVGTSRHLYAINTSNGLQRWRARNVNPLPQDIYGLQASGDLLVSDSAGGAFDDQDTHLLSLNRNTGDLLWESPVLTGMALHGVVNPAQKRLILAVIEKAHGDDRGFLERVLPGKGVGAGVYRKPQFIGLDLVSGRVLWRSPFDRKVRLRPRMEPAPEGNEIKAEQRRFDLNTYRPPFLAGEFVCVSYSGMSCYRSATGELAWHRRFKVLEDDLALAYANPLVFNDRIVTSGNSRLYALDRRSGKIIWRSKKSDYLPEIVAYDNTVYAQLGGSFFDLDRDRFRWRGEFGAMATDLESGKTLWQFDDADDSITNLLIANGRVWLADEKRLIALDRRTGKIRLRLKHRFKDKPTFAVLNKDQRVVLISQGEAAAFDRDNGQRLWYVRHPVPRPSVWRRMSAQLLQVSGTLLKLGSTAVSLSGAFIPAAPAIPIAGVGIKIVSSRSVARRTSEGLGRRFTNTADRLTQTTSFTELDDRHQYFLTELDGVDGVAIATVNIDTGVTVGLVPLPGDTPDIVIDDATGRLYQATEKRLTAISLYPTRL
jgi:outer membrane protein assembly factor BamB